MEAIKLTKNQEIQSIHLEPADNGGGVLRYTIHTPHMQNSDSVYDEQTEVYSDEEIETVALPRILELYKANYAKAKSKHPTPAPLTAEKA